MGKLNTTPRVPRIDSELQRELREHASQVNNLAEGKLSAVYNAATAAPTTGDWAQGDFIRHSNPTEQNTGGLKYVLYGWECVVAGTPGTWVECRFYTGGGFNITKLLKTSVTLNFPSIASNGTTSLTATVTGALAGDFVLLVPPLGLESGLTYSGWVTATDEIRVRLHNNSGGAIDPASASWGVAIMTIA